MFHKHSCLDACCKGPVQSAAADCSRHGPGNWHCFVAVPSCCLLHQDLARHGVLTAAGRPTGSTAKHRDLSISQSAAYHRMPGKAPAPARRCTADHQHQRISAPAGLVTAHLAMSCASGPQGTHPTQLTHARCSGAVAAQPQHHVRSTSAWQVLPTLLQQQPTWLPATAPGNLTRSCPHQIGFQPTHSMPAPDRACGHTPWG